MPAPGITVTSVTSAPPAVGSAPTGNWFVTGIASRGVIGSPILVSSMSQFAAVCGARNPASPLFDCADLFFRDGGTQMFVSRVGGTGQAAATLVLKDTTPTTALNTLTVNANSTGVWGNALTVAVTSPGAGLYQIVVTGPNGVETSPVLTQPADAVAWSSVSQYVSIVNNNAASVNPVNNPAVLAATPLAGGVDDTASITEATWTTALTAFTRDLGPGQVSAPGRTTDAAHQALLTHAALNNRVAYCDGVDTPTAATLLTEATNAIANNVDGSYGDLTNWVIIPGLPTGNALPAAPRVVPGSAFKAAVTAKSDGATYSNGTANTNIAPAAANGVSSFAIGVTQTYSDTDRAALNAAGFNVIRSIAGKVQLYGFRSLATDPTWTQLSWCRLRMDLQDHANTIASGIGEFSEIDAKGQVFGRLAGALGGLLSTYWQIGALFGATASAAYKVNVGPSVNTPATIAAGQLNAVMSVKRSPFAEQVNITIANVPLLQAM